jgi:hypothetical protein
VRIGDKPPGTQKQKINIGASRATGLLKKDILLTPW